eukprot:Gb_33810 [translate_table: standard]
MPSSARVREVSRLTNGVPSLPITLFRFNLFVGSIAGLVVCTGLMGLSLKRQIWKIAWGYSVYYSHVHPWRLFSEVAQGCYGHLVVRLVFADWKHGLGVPFAHWRHHFAVRVWSVGLSAPCSWIDRLTCRPILHIVERSAQFPDPGLVGLFSLVRLCGKLLWPIIWLLGGFCSFSDFTSTPCMVLGLDLVVFVLPGVALFTVSDNYSKIHLFRP